ncbi:hypothetical protein VCRA2119O48_110081 [Vibrio crassostreae]|nr:hypothetical protein VCRA2119O48_110081 [Vibrio crassostreae]CAK3906029.1 hypothetical protein VCRA212O16_330021 [Vibrio crassostreae]
MEEQKALLILNKKASKHSFLNEFVFRNFIYYIPYFITMIKYIFNLYFYNN